MQRENLLVRCLVKLSIGRGAGREIREFLSPDLNWAYFFERARNEGVISLVYKSLSEIDYAKSIVPEGVWGRLESCYYTIAARNTLLYEKLHIILNSFNQANIVAILLKGIDLAQTVYTDIGLRPMYDIDILIHEKDFPLVEENLKKLGYVNSASYPEDFHKDNMMVDVHWELMNVTRVKSRSKSYRINMDEIWQSSRVIEVEDRNVKILSPEHCLMDLCLHLTLHHGLSGLIWFVDIAKLIEHYKNEIDWNSFVEDCLKYKIYRSVYYTLCYVKENLGYQIPQFVLDGLKPKRQNFLERKIFDLILSGAALDNVRFLFTLLTMENLSDRLRFLREITLPSAKVLSARYNLSSNRHIPQGYIFHFKSILSSVSKFIYRLSA